MIAAGLFRAAVLDEPSLYQHLDVALDGLRGNSRLSLNSRNAKAGMNLDAIENCLLARVQTRRRTCGHGGLSGGSSLSGGTNLSGGTAEHNGGGGTAERTGGGGTAELSV